MFWKLDILKVVAGVNGGANVSNDNIRNTSRLVVSERTPTFTNIIAPKNNQSLRFDGVGCS
jgi:hypothetical protein